MASEYYFEKCWFNTESNWKISIWQITVARYQKLRYKAYIVN